MKSACQTTKSRSPFIIESGISAVCSQTPSLSSSEHMDLPTLDHGRKKIEVNTAVILSLRKAPILMFWLAQLTSRLFASHELAALYDWTEKSPRPSKHHLPPKPVPTSSGNIDHFPLAEPPIHRSAFDDHRQFLSSLDVPSASAIPTAGSF